MATRDDETDETAELDAPRKTSTDELIEHYLQESQRRDTIPYCYLFKYDDPKAGNDMQQIGHFTGTDIPNPHAVGLKFGAGRYGIKLYTAKGTAKNKMMSYAMFKLGENYDTLKAEAEAQRREKEIQKYGGTPTAPAVMYQDGTAQSFQMVKELLSLLLPVLTAANRGGPGRPPNESPAEMINSYAMMQKLLKNNLFDTAETMRQFAQRYAAPTQEAEYTEEAPTPSIVEKIVTMIEPFFNLIANKSPAASIAAQGIRAAPQFAEILNDPALCRGIVQHFDRTKGRAAADIALQNIGINRQQLFPAQGGPAPRQEAPRATLAPGNNGRGRPPKTPQPAAATVKT